MTHLYVCIDLESSVINQWEWQVYTTEANCRAHLLVLIYTLLYTCPICSKYVSNNNVNYFPNVDELTIEEYFKTLDDSISTTLNHILPLKHLTKLVIKNSQFTFEQIINSILFTSNLYVLKLDLLCFNGINLKLIQPNERFQYVSNTN
ncbi:unnamed protein product [Rotaria socialis]|uniref:Uncharacterized protein n=1 Tax=Rotaria socialis TaxID=392032 RepID=A0A817WJP4_9BILA|nr:unnamed protein product [Rotaria socialis]CAF3559893.1 unnamed protein product [Rotaria socialis]CAF4513124.1 unnamed protein product [Rotaria socialis]CAF4867298.1 unnamed protein product [Rotaria socialis]